MREITFAKNISALRKRKNVTQEQLAASLDVTPQAVSKWETATCLPDALMLPAIADYFGVSIDYLFYGKDVAYDDIYEMNFRKVAECDHMTGFEDALRLYAPIHHGISRGNLHGAEWLFDMPSHISGEEGLSLLSGKGYAALVTRRFFENVNRETAVFSEKLLKLLAEDNCMTIALAVISMSDISHSELKEMVGLSDEALQTAVDILVTGELLIAKHSKHKSLGITYQISSMYHTCLCVLAATLEMQRYSLRGISCCMGYGDYPVTL